MYLIHPYPNGQKDMIVFWTHIFSEFLFFVRQGRGVSYTPLQTFLSRERMQVAGSANNHPKATARAPLFSIRGAYAIRPSPDGQKDMIVF